MTDQSIAAISDMLPSQLAMLTKQLGIDSFLNQQSCVRAQYPYTPSSNGWNSGNIQITCTYKTVYDNLNTF